MLQGVGPITAKNLVAYCGGVEPIFKDPDLEKALNKTPRAGRKVLKAIKDPTLFERVEKELAFIKKQKIQPSHFYSGKVVCHSPQPRTCHSSPVTTRPGLRYERRPWGRDQEP